ncbi:MAG: hypothetical protein Ct9H300mP8_09500 [Gammaproteobacteria bacterium]|nr:MAG: hypothetical protein Ct9H300mP8_09500 [Gammaproteobacteria bacterium]
MVKTLANEGDVLMVQGAGNVSLVSRGWSLVCMVSRSLSVFTAVVFLVLTVQSIRLRGDTYLGRLILYALRATCQKAKGPS